ncbi:FAD-dependent monooxygenase [Streptacidiphilus cavernicola]|uniref:FAD-dependent monooxygenase n=1 Tax=Streptacidiphilus cavernicola TaxID=3342716 RepID=A0ABV6VR41_9ACTN
MRGGRVAVVGGSIAGCACAAVAARQGADRVVVLERSPGRLRDRGVGLCLHDARFAELEAAGFLDARVPRHRLTRRRWLVRDGAEPMGRPLWDQPFPFHSYHWGLLWQALRERLPGTVEYRSAAPVAAVTVEPDRAAVRSGSSPGFEEYDLVIGADGYRSAVREAVCPGVGPRYAGYVCWRGSLPAERLGGAARRWAPEHAVTVCFTGGQCVLYRIPGPGSGGPLLNWVLYAAPPDGALPPEDRASVPTGSVTGPLADHLAMLLERHLPPYWARVIALTPPELTSVQPVHDLAVPRRTAGRLLLAGDAATVVRPHNTSGAATALNDAGALEAAWRAAGSWPELLSGYAAARDSAGRELVALGRRLGAAQVEQAPDWSTMDGAGTVAWWEQQVAPTGFGGHALAR